MKHLDIYLAIRPMGAVRMSHKFKSKAALRYLDWKKEFLEMVFEQVPDFDQTECPLKVSAMFLFPMPPSWSKKKMRKMGEGYHRQKPDVDNCLKAVMDSLWPQDSRVSICFSIKKWASFGRASGGINLQLTY